MNELMVQDDPISVTDAMTLAGHFARSGYFKDAADQAKAIVKIMAGRELGIGPMTAMTGIHIVQGRPALSAGLIAALVLRSGRYTYTIVEQSETACRLMWQRDGRDLGESSFTIEEAKRAGLVGKDVWKAYPSDLLFARALTRGVRRYCAEITLGVVYTAEELGYAEATERAGPASSDINERLALIDDADDVVDVTPTRAEPPQAPATKDCRAEPAHGVIAGECPADWNAVTDPPDTDGTVQDIMTALDGIAGDPAMLARLWNTELVSLPPDVRAQVKPRFDELMAKCRPAPSPRQSRKEVAP